MPKKKSTGKKSKNDSQPKQGHPLHPGRKEHAEQFISTLEGKTSQDYATARLNAIWYGRKAPSKPRKLSAARTREIDGALQAIFATLR